MNQQAKKEVICRNKHIKKERIKNENKDTNPREPKSKVVPTLMGRAMEERDEDVRRFAVAAQYLPSRANSKSARQTKIEQQNEEQKIQ